MLFCAPCSPFYPPSPTSVISLNICTIIKLISGGRVVFFRSIHVHRLVKVKETSGIFLEARGHSCCLFFRGVSAVIFASGIHRLVAELLTYSCCVSFKWLWSQLQSPSWQFLLCVEPAERMVMLHLSNMPCQWVQCEIIGLERGLWCYVVVKLYSLKLSFFIMFTFVELFPCHLGIRTI